METNQNTIMKQNNETEQNNTAKQNTIMYPKVIINPKIITEQNNKAEQNIIMDSMVITDPTTTMDLMAIPTTTMDLMVIPVTKDLMVIPTTEDLAIIPTTTNLMVIPTTKDVMIIPCQKTENDTKDKPKSKRKPKPPTVTVKRQRDFLSWLKTQGKAKATIEKYGRDVKAFAVWLQGSGITDASATSYRQHLHETQKRDATGINSVSASLNSFFKFIKCEVHLKLLKIQRNTFKTIGTELTKEEYIRLLIAAKYKRNERLNLVLQTICSTGIRVSELCFITVEAVRLGRAEITNKGKTRVVFIPQKLKEPLLEYAIDKNICSGYIFRTRGDKPMNRSNIWAGMKRICKYAGVEPSKVYPHNLRSLFARLFYRRNRDIARLADILGHSDVNTTRIYLMESGEQHRRRINMLNLVVTEY